MEVISIKKEQIVDATIELLAEKGYFQTTTRMISQKAGIAVGTIYTHFPSKEAILEEIFQREFAKREEFLSLENSKNPTELQQFHEFIEYHFTELRKQPALATVLIRESSNPEIQHLPGVQKFIHQLPKFFTAILEKALKAGEIRNLNTTLTAEILFSTLRGITLNMTLKDEELDFEAMKKELTDFINYGIKNERTCSNECLCTMERKTEFHRKQQR